MTVRLRPPRPVTPSGDARAGGAVAVPAAASRAASPSRWVRCSPPLAAGAIVTVGALAGARGGGSCAVFLVALGVLLVAYAFLGRGIAHVGIGPALRRRARAGPRRARPLFVASRRARLGAVHVAAVRVHGLGRSPHGAVHQDRTASTPCATPRPGPTASSPSPSRSRSARDCSPSWCAPTAASPSAARDVGPRWPPCSTTVFGTMLPTAARVRCAPHLLQGRRRGRPPGRHGRVRAARPLRLGRTRARPSMKSCCGSSGWPASPWCGDQPGRHGGGVDGRLRRALRAPPTRWLVPLALAPHRCSARRGWSTRRSTSGSSAPLGRPAGPERDQHLHRANGTTQTEATKEWRLAWWGTIIGYTIDGPYFWTGKGYGINLADSGRLPGRADASCAAPHSTTFEVLARSGVPGLIAWVLLQAAFAHAMLLAGGGPAGPATGAPGAARRGSSSTGWRRWSTPRSTSTWAAAGRHLVLGRSSASASSSAVLAEGMPSGLHPTWIPRRGGRPRARRPRGRARARRAGEAPGGEPV